MVLIEVKEAARRLSVSAQVVRDLCDAKKLTAIRPSGNPNGKRVVVAESVEAYIASLVDAAAPKQPRVFNPPKVEFDDSERELRELIRLAKRRKA